MTINAERVKESRTPRGKTMRVVLAGGIVLWLAVVSFGLSRLWSYENTPGIAAEAPHRWPVQSKIQPSLDHATLVILAHPHCPCTRATIGELAAIMAHTQGRLTAYVVFLRPPGFSDDWEKADLWHSAAAIPGVKTFIDQDGAEANYFHALTSGQTLLYDAGGHLLYSGGITGSRGHAGDNAGQGAIVSLVNTGVAERSEGAVFGCPLFDPEAECRIPPDKKNER